MCVVVVVSAGAEAGRGRQPHDRCRRVAERRGGHEHKEGGCWLEFGKLCAQARDVDEALCHQGYMEPIPLALLAIDDRLCKN